MGQWRSRSHQLSKRLRMVRHSALRQNDLVMAPAQARRERWIDRRRFRYKQDGILPFARVRESLRTGDIILFHKTARTGLLDTLELDFVAPLFFERNEFRHSGIVVRRGDSLSVVECTEPRH